MGEENFGILDWEIGKFTFEMIFSVNTLFVNRTIANEENFPISQSKIPKF
jgi:hypothetical protein